MVSSGKIRAQSLVRDTIKRIWIRHNYSLSGQHVDFTNLVFFFGLHRSRRSTDHNRKKVNSHDARHHTHPLVHPPHPSSRQARLCAPWRPACKTHRSVPRTQKRHFAFPVFHPCAHAGRWRWAEYNLFHGRCSRVEQVRLLLMASRQRQRHRPQQILCLVNGAS